MNPALSIRDATADDLHAITELLSQLNASEGYDIVPNPEALAAAMFAPTREVPLRALLAQLDGLTVGALLYYPGYDTLSASLGFHLADMVVSHAYRRMGIGRALMRELAARAAHEGKAWVSLTVLKRNADARAFYQTMGLREVDVDFFAIGEQALMQM